MSERSGASVTSSRLLPSYGRRRGRVLTPGKEQLLKTAQQEYALTLPLAPMHTLFPHANAFGLEIGFGGGEHLAAMAKQYPQMGLIGSEPYRDGLVSLTRALRAQKSDNVRIWADDVRLLLPQLPRGLCSRVWINFPDPWPKARHHKRRLISHALLELLLPVMAGGAQLNVASDDAEYMQAILQTLLACPALHWQAKKPADWQTRPADSVPTRYEQKAIAAGRAPVYLTFIHQPPATR